VSEEDDKGNRLVATLQRWDAAPRLIELAKAGRKRLPGDHRYGDPLSTAGDAAPMVLGRRLSSLTAERPSALKELGLGALQIWQAVGEAQGRGKGTEDLALVFTDLVGFSDWALESGDSLALDLLRKVGEAVEPCVRNHNGTIVKRLGDGIMATFEDASDAVDAACEATTAVNALEVANHKPQMRAGVHYGTPRRLGGDYFGVDVNVAARIAAAAGANEVLVSDAVRKQLDDELVDVRRKWRFNAKGAPKDLKVYTAEPTK
jgi:adenylate cyclase